MSINLLPEQLKKKRPIEFREDFKSLILRFIFVWLILGVLWLILVFKISDYKRKLTQTEANWRDTQPLLEEKDRLTQHKKELNEFLAFLKQYVKKGISWSEKLTSLSQLVPEEVWFNEISLRKETKEDKENIFLDVLASVGYLKTDEEMLSKINDFIERIKKDSLFFKDFQNLSLFEITKGTGKEKFMNFKFSLSLKAGR